MILLTDFIKRNLTSHIKSSQSSLNGFNSGCLHLNVDNIEGIPICLECYEVFLK